MLPEQLCAVREAEPSVIERRIVLGDFVATMSLRSRPLPCLLVIGITIRDPVKCNRKQCGLKRPPATRLSIDHFHLFCLFPIDAGYLKILAFGKYFYCYAIASREFCSSNDDKFL